MIRAHKTRDHSSFDLVRARVTEMFEPYCHAHGLSILAMDIDRHGGREWSALHKDAMHHFLSVFVTFLGNEGDKMPFLLEFWYLIDTYQRYARKRFGAARRVSVHFP
jgi:hypothetical protein